MHNEKIQQNILGMLALLGYTAREVTVTHDEKMNTVWFSITGTNTRLLFNRDAEALSALNHLASKIAEQSAGREAHYPRVVIDANNFEKKKIDSLKTVAHMMAERARYFKSSIALDPMNAHDRKIIHEYLSEVADVQTESEGDGAKRHVVIRYVDSKL